MPTIRASKIASVAYHLGLNKRRIEITSDVVAQVGNVIAVRALGEKRVYNELELENGRMAKISSGNIIVGVLGRRRAPRGFVGDVPDRIMAGDTLHILNMGGVIGFSRSVHRDLGQPAAVEVLGMVVRDGRPINVRDAAFERVDTLADVQLPPLVMISGTSMNSGKTLAGTKIIQRLNRRGLTVHGGKIGGIACRRDSIAMEDHGAVKTASFLEAGFPSTAVLEPGEMAGIARAVISHLAAGEPDAIFLEIGDGILGDYGAMAVLEDPEIAAAVCFHLFCAGDLIGAWGGHRYLAERGVAVHLISGPVTDNVVGVRFVEETLGLPAINARLAPEDLGDRVSESLGLPTS